MNYILRNAGIYSTSKNIVENKNIFIEGKKIKRISSESFDFDIDTYDLAGYVILPGFINTHVHLATFNDDFDTADLSFWLKSGITTLRDEGITIDCSLNEIVEWRDNINNTENYPTVFVTGKCITSKDGYMSGSPALSIVVDSESEAREAVKKLVDSDVDQVKLLLHTQNGVHQYFEFEYLVAVCDEAHKRNTKVSAHVNSVHNLKILLEAGIDEAAHCCMDRIPDETLVYMVKNNVYMTPTLCVFGNETLKNAMDSTKRFVELGGIIGLGNDYITEKKNENPPGFPYKEIDLLYRAGLSPKQIIDAGTINGAKILNASDIGILQEGYIADIIAVKGNPYDDISSLKNIEIVIKNGVIIKNQLPTMNITH